MNQRIIHVHADDFGVSDPITDRISECITHGAVNSLSLVVNTDGFDYAVEKLRPWPHIRVCLHLNLIEGKPVASGVEAITDSNGEFRYSFFSLMLLSQFAPVKTREQIRSHYKAEIVAQIRRFRQAFGASRPLLIDSHMHFHMIPLIFGILMEISTVEDIRFIRKPYELRYLHRANLRNYLSANIVKNLLLNTLSRFQFPAAHQRQIDSNSFFVGVLSTGRTSYSDITTALEAITAQSPSGTIDILLHPGGVSHASHVVWTRKSEFHAYYASPGRIQEYDLARSNELKQCIKKYEDISGHRRD